MLVECGSTLPSRWKKAGKDMKYFQNACFFCSLQGGLLEVDIDPSIEKDDLRYEDFLEAGGWPASFAGQMVDTNYHDENISRLAKHFGVTIYLYTELYEGVTHAGVVNRYGNGGPVINIIKVLNSAHFNLMRWEDEGNLEDNEFFGAYKGLEKHIKKQKKQKKLENDHKAALALAEQFCREMEREVADRKLALSLASSKEAERLAEYRLAKQVADDQEVALKLAEIFIVEEQQIASDRELARKMAGSVRAGAGGP